MRRKEEPYAADITASDRDQHNNGSTLSNQSHTEGIGSNSSHQDLQKKTPITRYVLYFIIYSAIFWAVYCVYLYKTDEAFKQSFVRWYLKTFHHKKSTSITEASLMPQASHCVDFTTFGSKLPFKKSGGKSSTDYFVFTEEDLSHYNGVGENKKLPLLLAIAGRVYDVSEGKGS